MIQGTQGNHLLAISLVTWIFCLIWLIPNEGLLITNLEDIFGKLIPVQRLQDLFASFAVLLMAQQ
jgi:hypothetical protein